MADDVDRPVRKLGDSTTQREAEAMILVEASSQLDLPRLTPRTIVVGEGVSVTVDGAADGIVVEVYARQGKLKSAQLKKVAQDILKFRLLREVGAVQGQMLLIFASDEARASVRGWVLLAARTAGIELVVVDVGDEWRARLLDAQARQVMSSPLAVGDVADDSADVSTD